jgi:amino-acid N-acetyltransferase
MTRLLLRPARLDDVPAIEQMLSAESLPPFQVKEFIDTFWVLEQDGKVVGAAGVELYGEVAHLRSVVVAPSLRGKGQGDRLVREALNHAQQNGARRVYLFTMTAAPFFALYGFQPLAMEDFEPAAKESWQFIALMQMPEIAERLIPMRLEFE